MLVPLSFFADVVYVGTIHSHHLSTGKLFLTSHKNVLIEKPLAMNLREVLELTNTAKENDVFLMEVLYRGAPDTLNMFIQVYSKAPSDHILPHTVHQH